MNVLVTGSNGFIAKNLIIRLRELNLTVFTFNRKNKLNDLNKILKNTDFIVHLAGENRPMDIKNFEITNVGLTSKICDAVNNLKKKIPILFSSSIQAELPNAYGKSKLQAESIIKKFSSDNGSSVYIFRLPGVFGKWCKPNYNSVVATFCYNLSHNLPIKINDPSHELKLVYIDDVINEFIKVIFKKKKKENIYKIKPEYKIKLIDLSNTIKNFNESRNSLIMEDVGVGITKKLYSTYLSYISPKNFSYPINHYSDNRGVFAEVLKTKKSGQFSFFTAKPGITRGGHYHHTKIEKFLVLQGEAKFFFKNIITDKTHEIIVNSDEFRIVETIPGWFHEIKNVGSKEIIVMLWANENFNPKYPDTYNLT